MKDYSSLESKIRKHMSGRLVNGWERLSETLWIHKVAEIARVIDKDGIEHYINKAGEVVEDNTDKRRTVVNVGRPDTAKDPLDSKAKLVKQAEIKTKIIDEVKRVLNRVPSVRLMEKKKPGDTDKKEYKDDDGKDKKPGKEGKNPVVSDTPKYKSGDPKGGGKLEKTEGPKKADGSVDDNKDPKKITGDKTQVDIHPTTDDDLTDDSKEKKKGDKEAAKENKKAGAKSAGPVKEDTLDEMWKAQADKAKGDFYIKHHGTGQVSKHRFSNNADAISHAVKLNKHSTTAGFNHTPAPRTIDELSSRILKPYIKRAATDIDKHAYEAGADAAEKKKYTPDHELKIAKRHSGINKALNKLTKEEVLDEISNKTLKSYVKKAEVERGKTAKERRWNQAKDPGGFTNRTRGVDRANNRLFARTEKGREFNKKGYDSQSKTPKDYYKEEFISWSEEELAHFEIVMGEEYVDMTKKKCDEIINAKGKPHKVYTATDETRHGMGVDELKRHLGVGDSDSVHKKFMHNLHTAGVRTGWSHSAGKWIAYHGPKI